MISEQLRMAFDMVMQGKAAAPKGVWPTAEMMDQVRAANDQSVEIVSANVGDTGMTIEEGEVNGIKGQWYRLPDDDPSKRADKVMLYVHGGGFENGSVKSRRFLAMGIAKVAGVDCFSAEYTQWPEGHHPVALNQIIDAFHGLAEQYGAENIYMGGESGGAVLTLVVTHWLRDHGDKPASKLFLIGPVIEFSENFPSRTEREDRDPMLWSDLNDQIGQHYFAGADLKSPYVSPRYGNFEGFPPCYITVGTEEVLYDDAVTLHELLDAAGVENTLEVTEGAFHTFQVVPCPETTASLHNIAAFLMA